MKIYMPTDLINSNYNYEIYSGYYQVRTNRNCYSNYNTIYCDCYRVFYDNDYITSGPFTCALNTNFSINNFTLTDDWLYRKDMPSIILTTMIFIFIFWYVLRVILKGVGLNA